MHDLSQLSHSSLPDTSTPLQFPAQFMDLKDSWTFEFRSWWGYKMGERRLLTHHIERTCWPRPLVLANIINFHYGKPLRFLGVYLTLQLVSLQFIKHLVHWPNTLHRVFWDLIFLLSLPSSWLRATHLGWERFWNTEQTS